MDTRRQILYFCILAKGHNTGFWKHEKMEIDVHYLLNIIINNTMEFKWFLTNDLLVLLQTKEPLFKYLCRYRHVVWCESAAHHYILHSYSVSIKGQKNVIKRTIIPVIVYKSYMYQPPKGLNSSIYAGIDMHEPLIMIYNLTRFQSNPAIH